MTTPDDWHPTLREAAMVQDALWRLGIELEDLRLAYDGKTVSVVVGQPPIFDICVEVGVYQDGREAYDLEWRSIQRDWNEVPQDLMDHTWRTSVAYCKFERLFNLLLTAGCERRMRATLEKRGFDRAEIDRLFSRPRSLVPTTEKSVRYTN